MNPQLFARGAMAAHTSTSSIGITLHGSTHSRVTKEAYPDECVCRVESIVIDPPPQSLHEHGQFVLPRLQRAHHHGRGVQGYTTLTVALTLALIRIPMLTLTLILTLALNPLFRLDHLFRLAPA